MKKLLFITGLLLASCSSDSIEEESCRCTKEIYTYEQRAITGANGLPILQAYKVVLSNEVVPCQDEQEQVSLGDGNYFVIECGLE
jgi:hypothetical protein